MLTVMNVQLIFHGNKSSIVVETPGGSGLICTCAWY